MIQTFLSKNSIEEEQSRKEKTNQSFLVQTPNPLKHQENGIFKKLNFIYNFSKPRKTSSTTLNAEDR